MKKLLKILIGLILVTSTIFLTFPGMPMQSWGYDALVLIKGGIVLTVFFIGLLVLIFGILELRN